MNTLESLEHFAIRRWHMECYLISATTMDMEQRFFTDEKGLSVVPI